MLSKIITYPPPHGQTTNFFESHETFRDGGFIQAHHPFKPTILPLACLVAFSSDAMRYKRLGLDFSLLAG